MQIINGMKRNWGIWGLAILAAVLLFVFLSAINKPVSIEERYAGIVAKNNLLAQMRIHFLQSVEMEKNAVMALTDEASQEFADQSRASFAQAARLLAQLRSLIETSQLQDEMQLMHELNRCWTELGKLDQIILALAVQNTNLHATRLSREEGGAAMRRFEQALSRLQQQYSGAAVGGRIDALADRALIGGLKIYNLHSPHIAEVSDAIMEHIEQQMHAEEKGVLQFLADLDALVDEQGRDAAAQAREAFSDFMNVTAEVIKLSRQNSNVTSLDLSLGRKQKVTAQCDELIESLQQAVQKRTFKATR